jgi:hypothetical protein
VRHQRVPTRQIDHPPTAKPSPRPPRHLPSFVELFARDTLQPTNLPRDALEQTIPRKAGQVARGQSRAVAGMKAQGLSIPGQPATARGAPTEVAKRPCLGVLRPRAIGSGETQAKICGSNRCPRARASAGDGRPPTPPEEFAPPRPPPLLTGSSSARPPSVGVGDSVFSALEESPSPCGAARSHPLGGEVDSIPTRDIGEALDARPGAVERRARVGRAVVRVCERTRACDGVAAKGGGCDSSREHVHANTTQRARSAVASK